MKLKNNITKLIFPFLLFLAEEFFMFFIGEYNKTYLCKSIIYKNNLLDNFFTFILYNLFMLLIHFIIFFFFFSEQTLFLENKNYQKKIFSCLGLILICELCKIILYKIAEDKINAVYYIANIFLLIGIQIIIFSAFNQNEFVKHKVSVNKKLCVIPSVILIAKIKGIIIFENKTKNLNNNVVYKSSLEFSLSIILIFVTAFLQTSFLYTMYNKNSATKVNLAQQSILTIASVLCAVILYFCKLLLPEGMISQIHSYSMRDSNTENDFAINYFVKEVYRTHNKKNNQVYFSKNSEVYYDDEKICSYKRNDPTQSGEITTFFDNTYYGIIEENSLIVYKTSKGNFEYYFYNGKKSENFDESLLTKEIKNRFDK